MADRTVENAQDVPELDELLQHVLLYIIDEGRKKLDNHEELVPFTGMAVGDTLFMEMHPADDPDKSYAGAQHTVQHADGAKAYGFCYDGFLDTDQGQKDAIIAEGGLSGVPEGHALGLVYTMPEDPDGEIVYADSAVYLGTCPNFMALAKPVVDAGEGASDEEESDATPEGESDAEA